MNVTADISAKLTYHHGTVEQSGFNFVYLYTTPGADLLGQSLLNQATALKIELIEGGLAGAIAAGQHQQHGPITVQRALQAFE